MIAEVTGSIFIGSSADCSVGVGNLIRGKSYRKDSEGGYELECLDGEWISVHDVIEIEARYTDSTYIKWKE